MAQASTPQSQHGDSGMLSQNEALLTVKPSQELRFHRSDPSEPVYTFLTLHNTSASNVAFMIVKNNEVSYLITAPTGILKPGEAVKVMVQLTPGQFCYPKDRILILSMEVNEESYTRQELDLLWHSANEDQITRYNIRCKCFDTSTDLEETRVKFDGSSSFSAITASEGAPMTMSDISSYGSPLTSSYGSPMTSSDESPFIKQGALTVTPFGAKLLLLKRCQREFQVLQQKLNSVVTLQASIKFHQRMLQMVLVLMILLLVFLVVVPQFQSKPPEHFCQECGKDMRWSLSKLLKF